MRTLRCIPVILALFFTGQLVYSQDRAILIPKQIEGAPFQFEDTEDLFGQAYRWFYEGDIPNAGVTLRKLLTDAGINLLPDAYYVVVANFTDAMTPIGLIHGNDDFLSTRLYGLGEDNLYYIYITRTAGAESFLSVLAATKDSPFMQNLLPFIGLFIPLPVTAAAAAPSPAVKTTWIDVRRFTIPEKFRKFSDLSFIVKKDLSDEKILARAIFDNTSLERWSFGIATAITSIDDVDIIIGNDGRIIVEPKPNLDLATFGVINYHFRGVDTKAKTFGNSLHLLAGARLANFVEPIIGIGGGISLDLIDLHVFAGYSVEFANELKAGFQIGDVVTNEVDPFKLKLRGKPRFGLEIKFP